MGISSFRSLLIAAIVFTNCIPWIASRHHFKHNVNGHRSRHRRQGAGLFLPASYVIPGGEGEGAWGEWGEVSACSRTCGGGVAKQKRICLQINPDGQPLCRGGDTKYFSCQTQDCPEGALDFRSEQCAAYNDKSFKGNRYKWVPYTKSPNQCELNCMPHGERFYYRQQPKVVDGTRCNDESFDVCVDGVCQPVGCDMMLGSNAREDKCRQCRGNGTNCHTISGLIDSIEFRLGYNDVLLIPQGATNIVIAEVRASSNYLALRSKTNNVYYLNGEYHIDFPRSLMIAGTLWHYERSHQGLAAPDKLKCLGPTTEPLYLSILLQEENVGIEYEYSVPSALAPPPNQNYNWVYDEFSECNATCGGGYQYRQVTCRSRDDLNVVDENLCDVNFKPAANQSCNTDACAPTWVEGPWGVCSKPCGQGGTRSREVYCEKIITNGVTFRFQSKVADKECFDLLGPKPEVFQECNQNATCPTWFTGPWTHCDKLCGTGKQTRQVVCHQRINGRVEVFDDSECADEKPPSEQQCLLHPCDGVDWVLSEWSGCDSCLSTVRSRTAHCSTKSHEVIDSSFCAYHATPVLEEPCDTDKLPPCQFLWYASQWSNCSVQCGKGVQTRDVFCGNYDGESVTKVEDEKCDAESKFKSEKECEVPVEKCPAKWFAGAWSECTKTCGGGEQKRQVMCLNGGKESLDCAEDLVLDLARSCNEQPCDKDEILPMDSKSTPIIEEYDYEDCEDEEEYPDESAEAIDSKPSYLGPGILVLDDTTTTMKETITTDDGSGYSSLDDTTISETETVSGSTESTYETTDSTFESTTDVTETETIIEIEESTTKTSDFTGTSGSGPTEITETTEEDISESTVTDSTEISKLDTIDTTGTIEEETSESSPTEFTTTDSSESSPSESTTELGTTETSGSSSTDSSGPSTTETSDITTNEITEISTAESGSTETTESTSTDTSESSPTVSTTETSTTETGSTETSDTTETSEASSTTELGTSESTEPGSTDTTELSTTDTGSGLSESTTESGATEITEIITTGSSESSPSESTTEPGTTETSESGSTETTESDTTESTEWASTSTSESSSSESTTEQSTMEQSTTEQSTTEQSTTEQSTTEQSTTEQSTTELSTTETSWSSSTETTELSSTDSTEFSTTEFTEISTTSTEPGTTESTEETGSTETTVSSSTETTESGSTETELGSTETTPWIWTSMKPLRPKCKPKKTAKCQKSKFGCCPDNKTRATGPFDEGCPNPETCHDAKFGCCPDGVSPATGPHNKGCEATPCNQTLYGCCKSDNITAAEGNDQEGCPPPPPACKSSEFGCCEDEETEAKGPGQKGCPETETTVTEELPTSTMSTVSEISVGCENTEFGCCYDNETDASGPNGEGCPCSISEFGCCPDGISTAKGDNLEGCIMSCNTSAYGCCPDGETPAHGPEYEGCCLQYEFGCCPDNYKAAEGPHLEGCGCKSAHFGCCPDNVTIARGPNNEGCGCQYTQFGCCPDRRTESQGPEFEGCACHTYQFGCCADGVTAATGPNLQGCVCQYSKYGCCGDEATAAKGPNKEGCDCSNSKFGCCPDGVTEAKGDKFLNCSDVPENKQAACALPNDKGSCGNFSVYWFYDISYGGCVRFWYGGCEGNGNRFSSQEECEDVCVRPPPKDSCNLPKVKGICEGYNIRWYYDASREQCSQFVYGGCLGNNNNFDSQALCQERCEPEKTEDQCNLPIEQGSCAGNFVRWGYDPQRRSCEQFIWGGCEGNSNRFISEAACKLRCSPPGVPIQACSLPQDAGNCTEKHPAWSFSLTENRCIPFYYTGCGGNENRFDTEQACDNSCPSAYVQEMCTLPAVTGDCAEYTQRWYYDTKHKRCRQFYYGGCGGNENNFMSEFECENRCMEQPIVTTLAPQTRPAVTVAPQPQPDPNRSDFCFEEIDSGPCEQLEERWAYDSVRGVCTRFQYGGCGGTRNNFPSLEYCQYYCAPAQDICQLPMLSGPCDASLMRWFYDATTDSCSQFTYSGCEGNENRFNSMEECERQCRTATAPATTTTTSTTTTIAPEYIPPECQVSPTLEECRDAGEVWYLDLQQRACVVHINANSGFLCRNTGVYSSQEACERSCGAFRDLDVCRYQVDPGPCEESIPKVYFDYATSRCLQFTYGGCHGGPNRFSSIEECEQVCRPPAIDPCNQPPEQGDCRAYIYMWHYDASRDECGEFIYGGCKGNDNRFQTQQECENRCKKGSTTVGIGFASSSTTPTTTSVTIPNPVTTISPFGKLNNRFNEPECTTPSSVEPCGANITVYYYDTRTQACLVGDFGGCRYPNSYRTEEECERRCGAFRGLDVCRATLDPGPCLAAITKYYWDAVSGQCLPFAYGGCHGGPNRFSTPEECEEVCRTTGPEPACLQPVSSGEPGCALSSRRWYYHDVYGECIAFVYSGCGGTANNFPSYESCAVACKRANPAEPSENEVSCDGYAAECAALRCEYAVLRTRTPSGCERCACVPVDVDCEPLRRECDTLRCNYGVERTTGDDGCERCRCSEHPCLKTSCTAEERCVTTTYRDALTLDVRYSAECRIVNKMGTCPPRTVYSTTEGQCRTECNDDADCVGVGKCCARGCSRLCLEPASLVQSSPAPLHTTFSPDLPYAPRPSEQREPEVRAQEGGKATLRCFLHGNPPPRIIWRYGEITIEGDFGRYRMLSDGALEIVSLYRNDTGVYICVADNGLGVATQEIRLEVLDPVEGPAGISGTPNAVVVGEMGRSLSIRCLAYGYPQPAIYWYRGQNGPMVPYSSSLYEARGNVLQIRKLMPETLGEYICQAYNGVGKPADWAFVVQAYRPEGSEEYPYMVTRQTERSVTPYEHERQTEPTTARTTEVEIPYSVPVRTRITTDRTRLSSGSEINLPCDVDGFPVPEVYWTKDGVQIQRQPADDRIYVTEARLTITRANTNDSGVYGCHANNGYSSDYSTVQISVEGLYIPANCKDSPYFANCNLIVKSKFCHHKYYSTFCCKSCVEAGQLDPNELELMQADMAWRRK